MDAFIILFFTPSFQHYLSLLQGIEYFTVEEFVPQFVMEALDVALLPRSARRYVMVFKVIYSQPGPDSICDELRSIVAEKIGWSSMLLYQLFQYVEDISGFVTVARTQAVALAGVFVENAQYPKA